MSKVANVLYRWAIVQPKPNLLTKFLSEFIGCMIFHFLGSIQGTPWANAAVLCVLVYYTARMSGAHLNPALSVTFTMLGYINPVELVVYWCAQVSGSIVGALWLVTVLPMASVGGPAYAPAFGCFTPAESLNEAQIFAWEALCTFTFILPIFSVVWYTQSKSGYGNTGPIIVGLSLYASASAAAQWTGGALNPARVLASPAVFGCPTESSELWMYVLGELTGAALVPLAIIPWYGVSSRVMGGQWNVTDSADASTRRTNSNASSNTGAIEKVTRARDKDLRDEDEDGQAPKEIVIVRSSDENNRDLSSPLGVSGGGRMSVARSSVHRGVGGVGDRGGGDRGSVEIIRNFLLPLINTEETEYTCSVHPRCIGDSKRSQGNPRSNPNMVLNFNPPSSEYRTFADASQPQAAYQSPSPSPSPSTSNRSNPNITLSFNTQG